MRFEKFITSCCNFKSVNIIHITVLYDPKILASEMDVWVFAYFPAAISCNFWVENWNWMKQVQFSTTRNLHTSRVFRKLSFFPHIVLMGFFHFLPMYTSHKSLLHNMFDFTENNVGNKSTYNKWFWWYHIVTIISIGNYHGTFYFRATEFVC